jgi:hypothetical protein
MEQGAPPPAPGTNDLPQTMVSIRVLTRVVIILIAVWDAFAGLMLVAFHGSGSGALGAGVEDEAGQRLLGAHLLILVPAYLQLAWKPDSARGLAWLPYAGQLAFVVVVGYNLLTGATVFSDGGLAFAVSLIFIILLGFLWITEQRTIARIKMEAEEQAEAAALKAADSQYS